MRPCSFVFSLFFCATAFSPANSQSLLPTSFQERVQTAVAGGKAIRSISLTGTAEWFAGSVHETGTAQLLANADGSTHIQLNLGKASRIETRTNSPRTCQWADSTGKSHEISVANCLTSVPWFAPSLGTQFSAQPPSNMVSTDDGEIAKDQSSFHQISYSLNLAQKSNAMTKRIAKASTTKVLFDPRTLLPASLEYAIHPDEDDLQSLDVKVVFSDYRSVAGLQLPFHIERFVNRSLQLKLDISNASIE